MSKLIVQRGYSLIELLIALLISTVLILSVSTVYSSITGLVNTSKNLENAQEVLRYSSEVFTRSLKQTSLNPTVTSTQLNVEQTENNIACDGSIPVNDYTEVFTLNSNNLLCDIGDGPKVILTGIESINFSSLEKIISITVQPQALYGESSGSGPAQAIQIDIALSQIILINAMGL
ncbi:prepilin-type N-terminal cleavage/methylation domain-containing protein [uncultured Psychromonas sp.]|uniref:prepilin-type N-terminal cleavage/methylation domain-containing protein n=1 Tax=uncultured Psychromonas sp. TaxID=173974 RepID=UPI0026114EDA|nr:prepilin-type N-terminal cleavage/methylation domain-containing protein [uncultured Psychromonas sp.]